MGHIVAFPSSPCGHCFRLSSTHQLDSFSSPNFLGPIAQLSFKSAASWNALLLNPRGNANTWKHFCSPKLATETVGIENVPPLYADFVQFAIREIGQHTPLVSYPFQEDFKMIVAMDGKTTLYNDAFQSSKIRLFRIATIAGGDSVQVFNMAILPRPDFDLPIFCADFFSTSTKHIIVLDLNPLYNAEKNKNYKQKYYSKLIPLANKYVQMFPWGQKLTTESLQFFSPLVIWTKLESRQEVQERLFLAFQDYLKAWLELMDEAKPSNDSVQISENQRAQHRYLLWRATKDPGRPLLHRLFGEELCETYVSEFLFNGVTSMGKESFLDYFPEYRSEDGSIKKERSVIGKSCFFRPWDKEGNFINL